MVFYLFSILILFSGRQLFFCFVEDFIAFIDPYFYAYKTIRCDRFRESIIDISAKRLSRDRPYAVTFAARYL